MNEIAAAIKKARAIRENSRGVEAAKDWRIFARGLIVEFMGEGHAYATKFDRISFNWLRIIVIGPEPVSDREMEERRQEDLQAAYQGLERAEDLLLKLSQHIREYGIPGEQTAKSGRRWALLLVLIPVIAPLFFPEVRVWLGLQSDKLVATSGTSIDPEQQAEVILSDLNGWYESNDAEFLSKYERMCEEQANRGMFESGFGIKEIIEFSEGFRRERDNTIDSFFVRLKALGVNPDTLQVERRLPIRLARALKGRLDRLGLYEEILRTYHIDTL